MTQITKFKPLDDKDSEYGVRSYPQKDHNNIANYLCGHGVLLNRENWIFTPFFYFFAPLFNLICPSRNFYTPNITVKKKKIFAPFLTNLDNFI